ncbi:MAG: hypothetical protein D6718_04855 [Acidobacteria bacterium]|nr:MAG: hypothetical protein D6718_04855 [Acidobacteriota bacterium]
MKGLASRLAPIVLLAAGLPALGSLPRGATAGVRPHDLVPTYHDRSAADGPVFMAEDANGRLWATWAYRAGGEWDIAVSRAVGRVWTAPQLLGVANGMDDLDPRLLFLPDGTGILAWWQRGPLPEQAAVVVSYLDSRTGTVFSPPERLSDDTEVASHPSLFLTDGMPLVGYTARPADGEESRASVAVRPLRRQRPDGGAEGPEPWPDVRFKPPKNREGGANDGSN